VLRRQAFEQMLEPLEQHTAMGGGRACEQLYKRRESRTVR
jgi:hypothetical protein